MSTFEYALNVVVSTETAEKTRKDILSQFGESPTNSGKLGDGLSALIYVFDERVAAASLMSMVLWYEPKLTLYLTEIQDGDAGDPKVLATYFGNPIEGESDGLALIKTESHA